jgi:hypothetical protein
MFTKGDDAHRVTVYECKENENSMNFQIGGASGKW